MQSSGVSAVNYSVASYQYNMRVHCPMNQASPACMCVSESEPSKAAGVTGLQACRASFMMCLPTKVHSPLPLQPLIVGVSVSMLMI